MNKHVASEDFFHMRHSDNTPAAGDILKRSPLFSGLAVEDAVALTAQGSVKTYAKRETVFCCEEPAEFFYIIIDGRVKLFRDTLDGQEAVIDVLSIYHVFGEAAAFSGNVYSYSAQAIEHTMLLVLPSSALENKVKEDGNFALHMCRFMAEQRTTKHQELEHRDVQNASQRIGCFFLRLCPEGTNRAVTLHLPYDKTLLAARLGMKAETFSRALGKLQKEVDMQVKGSTVDIRNIAELAAFSCSACSDSFPCKHPC